MMINRLISTLVATAVSFLASAYFISGFDVDLNNLTAFGLIVLVFTFIHLIIKPLVKLLLLPLIILSLGVFNLVITGGLLYIVDKYSESINISGLTPLIYATLIITAVNLLLNTGHGVFNRRK